jgi:hypothetical protein
MAASVIPSSATASTELSVPELAQRIKDHLKEMEDTATQIKQRVLRQALDLGALLLQAKAKVGHGRFGTWLEKNCELSERSAQRYMALKEQWPKIETWLKDNSATVADLSLNKAQRIITAQGDGDETAPSDKYDKAEDRLIARLQALDVDAADTAAEQTIKALRKTVGTMKAGAKAA